MRPFRRSKQGKRPRLSSKGRKRNAVWKVKQPKKKRNPRNKMQAKQEIDSKSLRELKTVLRVSRQNGENLSDVISSIKKMHQLEEETGRPYKDLLAEYENMTEVIGRKSESIQAIEKQRNSLTQEIRHLEDLKEIQKLLQENNVNTRQLLESISDQKELGFDSATIRLVSWELKKRGIDAQELASKIQRFAPRATSLEHVLSSLEQKVAEARKEESAALARLDSLNSQAEEVKAGVLALKEHLASQSRDLEKEYEIRRRVLDSQIQEERTRREQETIELLKLRDRTAGAVQALKEEEQSIRDKIKSEASDTAQKN